MCKWVYEDKECSLKILRNTSPLYLKDFNESLEEKGGYLAEPFHVKQFACK